jgi:hypothetical protein
MALAFLCPEGWDTAATITAVLFFALLAVFTARIVYRKSRGATWDEAWGRQSR